VSVANGFVVGLLGSPLHRLLSGSTDAIRYVGRRSGTTFTTPTQFARLDDGIVILVGRPATKQWWRNFGTTRDLDVLLDGAWVPMRGIARVGAQDPTRVAALLQVYLARFPKVARTLPTDPDERVRSAVLVECHPR
jgi:hypothetical protein